MRLILLNPHTFHFKKLLARYFNGKKNLLRYGYLMENHGGEYEIAFMANGSRTSFQKSFLRKILLTKTGSILEIVLWLFLNRINPFHYKIYSTTKNLDPSQDILLTFGVDICKFTPNQLRDLQRFEGLILVHLTHYFYDPVGIEKACAKLKNVALVSESDLSNNKFFNAFFSKDFKHIVLPFSFSEKFTQIKNKVDRINKCVAVGTVLTVNQPDYLKFFGSENPVLQPMRKKIFNEASKFPDELVNIMRDPAHLKLGLISEEISSNYDETKIEKSYYSVKLDDYFKSHAMFVTPEESIGLPSSNFVDGMISGCVYFGANLDLYKSYGMEPGVHYVAYKEYDFLDLLNKIRYYQANLDDLQKISIAGRNFAASNFSAERIRNRFSADLKKFIS